MAGTDEIVLIDAPLTSSKNVKPSSKFLSSTDSSLRISEKISPLAESIISTMMFFCELNLER